MNAEALKCFQNFVFCNLLRVYTLTDPLAILKPTRSRKQSLMVESSYSDEARNGAHSLTFPTATINRAFPTFFNAHDCTLKAK